MKQQNEIYENTVIVDLITGEEMRGQLKLTDSAIEKCAAILANRLTEFMKSGREFTPDNVFGRTNE